MTIDKCVPAKIADYHRYSKNTVRAYNHSPSTIAVQVRTDKGYATALLEPTRAADFARAILAAINEEVAT